MSRNNDLRIYTLYDKSTHFPNNYVIRGFTIKNGETVPDPTIRKIQADLTIENVHEKMNQMGLMFIPRDESDEENIIGCYI